MNISTLLKKLPKLPGVYKLKNGDGEVLYVGKAKDLSARVRSYFRKEKGRSVRLQKLVEKTEDVEWIEVGSDLEAIVLESNLIKELKPKYNVLLKDDKNFVYVKITKEDFPRVKIVRKVEKDGARYFGPKTAAGKVKKTLLLLQKLFKYRSCDLGMEWKNGKVKITKKTIAFPCLDFHIKRCEAPCIGNQTPEEYGEAIRQIELFLEGKTGEIEKSLKVQMEELVKDKKFEKAGLLRDRLVAIQELSQKQLVSSPDHASMDVFGFVVEGLKAYFNLFMFRDGKLINQENFVADAGSYEEKDSELLASFLYQYYEKAADKPKQVLLPLEIEDEFFEEWADVKVLVPQKGKKNKLIELSRKNAESFMKQHKARFEIAKRDDKDALKDLGEVLGLEKLPKRIEAYDISHLGGTDTVASMVVFEDGVPKKSDYRKFRMKSLVDGEVDDYKSMKEVLRRRLGRIRKDIAIRQATKTREKDILRFFKDGWNQKERHGDLKEYYLAYSEKKPIGMVRMIPGNDGLFLLESLYVEPDFRKKGIGRALMKHAIAKTKAKRVYIFCFKELVEYYKKFGAEDIKQMPDCFAERVAAFKKRNSRYEISMFAYNPGKHKDKSFAAKPDLILLDGGKGQLGVGVGVLKEYGLELPLISLAKREEEVFLPGGKKLQIPPDAKALYLLRRVRDEAHRFAIKFQRGTRKGRMLQ
jgi:excinuclease ABC subunit C